MFYAINNHLYPRGRPIRAFVHNIDTWYNQAVQYSLKYCNFNNPIFFQEQDIMWWTLLFKHCLYSYHERVYIHASEQVSTISVQLFQAKLWGDLRMTTTTNSWIKIWTHTLNIAEIVHWHVFIYLIIESREGSIVNL